MPKIKVPYLCLRCIKRKTKMGTFLIAAICAATFSAENIMAPADTLVKYVIDGNKVENFNGTQLIGKTVSAYDIMVATNHNDGSVTKIHLIKTSSDSEIGATSESAGILSKHFPKDNVVYILNGEMTDRAKFSAAMGNLPAEKIKLMQIHKAGSPTARKITGKDDVKVMELNIKKNEFDEPENIFYTVDGKEVSRNIFSSIPADQIKSIQILKAGGSEAVKISGKDNITVIKLQRK